MTDIDCLRAACAGENTRAARRGRALVDRALATGIRQVRDLDPAWVGRVLRLINRNWPALLRDLRRDVARSERAR